MSNSVVPLVRAVTINYHHTTGSRAPSLDDDEEEEDRLHAMISMICSRNLTDPNVTKGFYQHRTTPSPQTSCPPLSPSFRSSCPYPRPCPVPPALSAAVCAAVDKLNSVEKAWVVSELRGTLKYDRMALSHLQHLGPIFIIRVLSSFIPPAVLYRSDPHGSVSTVHLILPLTIFP